KEPSRSSRERSITMRGTALAVVCVLFAVQTIAQTKKTPLENILEANLGEYAAKTGVYVKHLTTGEAPAVRADEEFNSYSVIKLGIMCMAYDLAQQKKLNLDERYEIHKADFRGGSWIFRYHSVGFNPTFRDVITEMVITSDNTATDIMLAKVG